MKRGQDNDIGLGLIHINFYLLTCLQRKLLLPLSQDGTTETVSRYAERETIGQY